MNLIQLLFPHRLNRLEYLTRLAVLLVIFIVGMIAIGIGVGFIMVSVQGLDPTNAEDEAQIIKLLNTLVKLYLFTLYLYAIAALLGARFIDTGKTRTWCLLGIFPIFGLLMLMAGFIIPSKEFEKEGAQETP